MWERERQSEKEKPHLPHRPRAQQLLAYRRIVWTFERFCLLSISRCLILLLSPSLSLYLLFSLSLSCAVFFVGSHALCHASVNASLLHTFSRPVQSCPVLSSSVDVWFRFVDLPLTPNELRRRYAPREEEEEGGRWVSSGRHVWKSVTRHLLGKIFATLLIATERRKISFSSATIAGNCLENLRSYPLPSPSLSSSPTRLCCSPPRSGFTRRHASFDKPGMRTAAQTHTHTLYRPHPTHWFAFSSHSPFSFASWHCRSIAQTLFVCTDFASFHLRVW